MTPRHEESDTVLRGVAAAPAVRPGSNAVSQLAAGDVIGGRFAIEALESEGGMGVVYRASDRESGAQVALKVMRTRAGDVDRFTQEARVLAELFHPSIVRYIAHGTHDGALFLVMEWLDGETLEQRLVRAPLSVNECIALARGTAAGLAAAHARSIIHRDVKPSNLFLVGGDPARIKLIDFGIARPQLQPHAMTRTGAIIGTVGYMAPEQATSDPDVDARADVFALGCVLFECLTGRPVFTGVNVVSVLAKVVLEDAPRLSSLRPELAEELDALLARMLAKDREVRPGNAALLLGDLEQLGELAHADPVPRPLAAVTGGERRLMSVILARPAHDDLATLQALVQPYGGEAAWLIDGTLLVTFAAHDSATDLAAQAASCALALRAAYTGVPIALATGRAETSASHPVGPAIDRAAALLGRSQANAIPIDQVTAGLLETRFEVAGEGETCALVGKRDALLGVRTLLGKPTPFVGRDKELALLEATLSECVRESVARAVLVSAPAGAGKSRLRYELIQRVTKAGDVVVLVARADPMGAGSSLSLIRQLVRKAAGLRDGDPVAEQGARLRAHLATLPGRQLADLLGELVGATSTDEPSPELRAARGDPRAMAEGLRRAFQQWIAGECSAHPLLVVLEDLHWSDTPSVVWLAETMKRLAERPLMVLALARPEAREQFPALWTQELPLGGLTRRAAEKLVRAVLGDEVAPALITRIVERADGNAYYLEELIRRVAEGGSEKLPETVLAMVQSRLLRLEPEARRLLRAASVFGETFWEGSVAALLGGRAEAADWLHALAARELVQARDGSKFPGQVAYVFRHGLLREAAYAMLTEADRTAAHHLAAEWLEIAGEKDARVLADHFELGGSPARALPWLLRAAEEALEATNLDAVIALGDRGVACGAKGETLGILRGLQGQVFLFRNEVHRAVECAREALDLLPEGSMAWFSVASAMTAACFQLADFVGIANLVRRLESLHDVPRPDGPVASAFSPLIFVLFAAEQIDQALALSALLERSAALTPEHDPTFEGFLLAVRSAVAQFVTLDLGAMVRSARASVALLDSVGSMLPRVYARGFACVALWDAGCYEEVRTLARDGIALSREAELPAGIGWLTLWLARAEVRSGSPKAAAALLEPFVASQNPNPALLADARSTLAEAYLPMGRLDDAERLAQPLTGIAVGPSSARVHWVLARVALARGRPREALEIAGRVRDTDVVLGRSEGSILRLLRVEALLALGDDEAARTALREARDRILRLAATLGGDPSAREHYLANNEANARTLELARELLEEQ